MKVADALERIRREGVRNAYLFSRFDPENDSSEFCHSGLLTAALDTTLRDHDPAATIPAKATVLDACEFCAYKFAFPVVDEQRRVVG
jgi:hypothetical protein